MQKKLLRTTQIALATIVALFATNFATATAVYADTNGNAAHNDKLSQAEPSTETTSSTDTTEAEEPTTSTPTSTESTTAPTLTPNSSSDTSDTTDTTTVRKIRFCHATGSTTNPYVLINTSVSAFYHSGHNHHEDDIVPAFSYVKHGQTIQFDGLNMDAANQELLDNDCNSTPTPPPAPCTDPDDQSPACNPSDDTEYVTPAAVVATYPTCTNTTSGFTVTATDGVKYKLTANGLTHTVQPGFTAVTPGQTVTITAVAKGDRELTQGSTSSWQLSFAAVNPATCDVCPNVPGNQTTVPATYVKDTDGNCYQPGGRGGDEPTPPTTTTTTLTSARITPPKSVVSKFTPAAAPELANTGTANTWMIAVAGVMIIMIAIGAGFSTRKTQLIPADTLTSGSNGVQRIGSSVPAQRLALWVAPAALYAAAQFTHLAPMKKFNN